MIETSCLVGRSNQDLFAICSNPDAPTLPTLVNPKKHLQTLELLQPGAQFGTTFPDSKKVRTPGKHSLIAQAVRTAFENGGADFAGLDLDAQATLCETLAFTMSIRSRQEAVEKTKHRFGASFYSEIGLIGRENQRVARILVAEQAEIVLEKPIRPLVQKLRGFLDKARGRLLRTTQIGLAAFTLYTSTVAPIRAAAAYYSEPALYSVKQEEIVRNDAKEVPVISQKDFAKFSERFPKETRETLSHLVTLNQGIFDGSVAYEIAYLQQKLASNGYASLSPHMVDEVYGAYEYECENDPSGSWQDSADRAVQGYVDKIKTAISEVDLSKIQPPAQPQVISQAKGSAPDSTESTNSETPQIIDFGDRIPNPDFNKILKHSVILDNPEDFLQILVLQGFKAEEIEKIKVLLKFGTLISSYSEQDTIFEILREAAKKNLALSPAQVAAGLQFVQKNNINLGFLDAVELYVYLQSLKR